MDTAISKVLKYSIAVESCFLAAGATVTGVALVQSASILWSWL